ncbi:unnamed protein product [Closterium sp. Yama58-4]|nr:unnamed protein product [Closterium sp. Yama58-4]
MEDSLTHQVDSEQRMWKPVRKPGVAGHGRIVVSRVTTGPAEGSAKVTDPASGVTVVQSQKKHQDAKDSSVRVCRASSGTAPAVEDSQASTPAVTTPPELGTPNVLEAVESASLSMALPAADVSCAGTRAPDVGEATSFSGAASLDHPLTQLLWQEGLLSMRLVMLSTPRTSASTSCAPACSSLTSTPTSSTTTATQAVSATPSATTTPATPTTPATTTSTAPTTATTTAPATATSAATPTTLTLLTPTPVAPPARSRRRTGFLSTEEVNSNSRGDKSCEEGRSTFLKKGGAGSTMGDSYSVGSGLRL